MIVGIPKEIKPAEHRVAITPSGVHALAEAGHTVLVEHQAGIGSGFSDTAYEEAGAQIIPAPSELFERASLILKVKEPLPEEYERLQSQHTLFTYLHLASNRQLTTALLEKKLTAIAYESVVRDGRTPLLEPMSEIAGKMAPMVGGYFLEKHQGGVGVLPGGVAGVLPADVLVLGAGMAGLSAAKVAAGLGAHVMIMDVNPASLQRVEEILPANVSTAYSDPLSIREALAKTDMVVGAVYLRNAKTPHLITREMLSLMKPGTVLVDISIDQGGCFETSHPTTHDDPVFTVDGIVHYCVANMPGAYPRTATQALTHRTLPYVLALANQGTEKAIEEDSSLQAGVNCHAGKLYSAEVAKTHQLLDFLN